VKVVLTMVVRDEEDILDAVLRFHLETGVDLVLATDHGSGDGTAEILRRYEREGALRRFDEPGGAFAQARWVTRMARLAAVEHGADWVVHADADEFWWSDMGNLPSALAAVPARYGSALVPRTGFRPAPAGAEGLPFHRRMLVREVESRNPLGRPLPPKVCHRAAPAAVVAPGNHRLVEPATEEYLALPVTILHFPVRSYEQLRRKVLEGAEGLDLDPDGVPSTGSHWRHLRDIERAGRLREWYEAQVAGPADAAEGSGLVADRRLERYFAGERGPGSAARRPNVP
jgi:hypothetical protein